VLLALTIFLKHLAVALGGAEASCVVFIEVLEHTWLHEQLVNIFVCLSIVDREHFVHLSFGESRFLFQLAPDVLNDGVFELEGFGVDA